MKTSELIEHVAKDMLDDRAALVEGASDRLFSDEKVLRYLNEAERKLCRDALVLEDLATPSVCEIQLIEDRTDYPFHKSILQVKSVRLSDSDLDLLRVGYNDNRIWPITSVVDPDFWDVNLALVETPGRPQRYSVDMGTRIIRVRRKPDADAALLKLKLAVMRMPVVPMTIDDPDKQPEVPEEHHLDLTLYAAGSCLTKTADIDAELRTLGQRWMNEFQEVVDKAKRDKQRRQMSMPQFRFGGWVSGDEHR
jgi:hypothetical protein